MENFYYERIYDVFRECSNNGANLPVLNCFKAKIVIFQSDRTKTVLLVNKDADRIVGEQPTLHHIIRMQKRRATGPSGIYVINTETYKLRKVQ
jgi:hypothetical protein